MVLCDVLELETENSVKQDFQHSCSFYLKHSAEVLTLKSQRSGISSSLPVNLLDNFLASKSIGLEQMALTSDLPVFRRIFSFRIAIIRFDRFLEK